MATSSLRRSLLGPLSRWATFKILMRMVMIPAMSLLSSAPGSCPWAPAAAGCGMPSGESVVGVTRLRSSPATSLSLSLPLCPTLTKQQQQQPQENRKKIKTDHNLLSFLLATFRPCRSTQISNPSLKPETADDLRKGRMHTKGNWSCK